MKPSANVAQRATPLYLRSHPPNPGTKHLADQLKRLSDCGDPLETMGRVVNFEVFRPALEKVLAYGDGAKGGRPPYDPVAMFKVLILAAQNTVSDARMDRHPSHRSHARLFQRSRTVLTPRRRGELR
jgi:hypothetical protein